MLMRMVLAVAGMLVLSHGTVWAQGQTASSPAELARQADRLEPGSWVWAAQTAPRGPILVYVDLSRQLATVYRNGVRVGVSTVSSGKAGHETPTGVFTILQKDAKHRSSTYDNAPMPFQERLTWDGVALHAGGLPGYPESHGCVHLPYGFARELFGFTTLGATVVISEGAVDHVRTSGSGLLAPFDEKGRPARELRLDQGSSSWHPERAVRGPMTIIVSKSDQRVVVLRNGVEIGRAAALIDDEDPGSHVVTLTRSPAGTLRWTYVGLPGHHEDAARPLDEATANRLHVPRSFYEQVKAALQPGTTVLITQSSVGDDGAESRLTILDAVPARP